MLTLEDFQQVEPATGPGLERPSEAIASLLEELSTASPAAAAEIRWQIVDLIPSRIEEARGVYERRLAEIVASRALQSIQEERRRFARTERDALIFQLRGWEGNPASIPGTPSPGEFPELMPLAEELTELPSFASVVKKPLVKWIAGGVGLLGLLGLGWWLWRK